MKKEGIRDGTGAVKPTHECPNRSPLAKAIAHIYAYSQKEGWLFMPARLPWEAP
jgi:hypothetical protein